MREMERRGERVEDKSRNDVARAFRLRFHAKTAAPSYAVEYFQPFKSIYIYFFIEINVTLLRR